MSDSSKNSSCLKQICVFQKDGMCLREYFRIENRLEIHFIGIKILSCYSKEYPIYRAPLGTSLQY